MPGFQRSAQDASPEEASGWLGRIFFFWLNPLFSQGFRSKLTMKSLPRLDKAIAAASEPKQLAQEWRRAEKSSRNTLLWTLLLHYKWNLLAGIIPRLAYTGFIFAEPFLVEAVLDFTAQPDRDRFDACILIVAYAVVYLGKATTYAYFQHKTYRLVTIFRGSLISLIYDKTVRICSAEISDAEAVTLMSADIDRIAMSLQIVYDFLIGPIELVLALCLLFRLLGVAMVAPGIWVTLCLLSGIPVATAAGNAQEPWLEAIEERLVATTQLLAASNTVRFAGLSRAFSTIVSELRSKEINASRRHRIFSILETGITYASSSIAPVLAFGGFILLAKTNHTETLQEGVAFASLSLFQLLDEPLVHISNGFEDIQTLVSSIGRIQQYLLLSEKETLTEEEAAAEDSTSITDENVPLLSTGCSDVPRSNKIEQDSSLAVMQSVAAGYAKERTIIQGIDLCIALHKTTVIVGPIASGKSTFLRLLIGELPHVAGSFRKSFSNCAYCPQTPWICWGSIRSNIIGASVWDAEWYKTVVQACALVADFNELPEGDQTKTGTRGSRLSGGQKIRVALARALFARESVMILDDVLTGLDRATEQYILDAVFGPCGLVKQLQVTVVLSTNSAAHVQIADNVVVFNNDGTIAEHGTVEAVSTSGGYVQRLEGKPAPETSRTQLGLSEEALLDLGLPDDHDGSDIPTRPSGDLTIYRYFIHVGGKWTTFLYIFACGLYMAGVTFPSVWLQWWTNSNALHPNDDISYWLGIYGFFAMLAIFGCLISDSVFQLVVVPTIARKFHELLLASTMQATTTFLASTDSGQITNRFSQDLQLIDNDLPDALDQTVVECFNVIIAGGLVFTGSGYLIAAVPFCIFAVYTVQSYYLRTSQQLRLLDIEAKAPLFSHFLETLDGLSSIRVYGWADRFIEKNQEILQESQQPYYLLWCIRRWIGLVLDLLTGAIAVLLIAFATTLRQGRTGLLGVAIFNLIDFSAMLQRLIGQWVHVETALAATGRIRTYTMTTPAEDIPPESTALPRKWPLAGAVVFSDISASYGESNELVLKNITLSVAPGQKVAICGRTGSGKSSLLSSLLHMIDIDSGTIIIDGVDIRNTERQTLRERVNALPQDQLLLHGTFHDNVDPLGQATEEDIMAAIHDVNMAAVVEDRGGVHSHVGELSHGQQQLLCLARALVRPGKLLLLDEATSSIDIDNEKLVRRIIMNKFNEHTIIAVVHKLHTIFDFDHLLLMENGRIVEQGNPRALLASEASQFRSLYNSTEIDA
ncbi:hypothetical protein NLG97_g6122 [Lecanicillium saksenae]|uniref:Uncharacterized protein n=1 Tax=Lecanicillium saksenae TaxID=468837 RepID=A0ACC1QQJ3_9HYPO|nr:hypothetical protein NLG97_g6122 [Lecanicillium saksenae]